MAKKQKTPAPTGPGKGRPKGFSTFHDVKKTANNLQSKIDLHIAQILRAEDAYNKLIARL